MLGFAACHGDASSPPPPPTGSLSVSINGLPAGTSGAVTVTGPGFSRTLTASAVLTGLVPGQYTITAASVLTSLSTFVPAAPVQTVPVGTSPDPVPVVVVYSVTSGSLNVVIAGLPSGVSGKVVVRGPGGFADSVTSSATLGNLSPGVYSVAARNIQAGSDIYAPRPDSFTVTVLASLTSAQAVIGYALASGSLSVLVNGLPQGTPADVGVTGPDGFARQLTGTATLDGLFAGRYVLASAPVTVGSTTYASLAGSLAVTVVAGATAAVSVNYSPTSPTAFNLVIDAVQVQQVVQTDGDAVPLVAGRTGLLRVFARATATTTASPPVRVWFYDGSTLASTIDIPAPAGGVPATLSEGDLGSTWNYAVPASLMKPGLRVLAEVDPDNVVAELSDADNTYPSSGTPLALDVRAMPSLTLRLVPVTQSANGLTGDVSDASLPAYLDVIQRLMPVSGVTADVRATYTTSAPALDPNDANGAWVQILSEIDALRAADGSAADYYGVVKTSYTAGVIGIGLVPGRAAAGWDVFPSAAETYAHELGHNLGRFHSPCGTASARDANYPYSDGSIGVYGYDATTGTLRVPSTPDIMGYCPNRWISDYTYTGIIGYLASQAQPTSLAALQKSPARPGLLVWGHIDRHGVVLEPAYEVMAPPRLPERRGPDRLEVLGESGELLSSLSFAGNAIADAPDSLMRTFAWVIPLDAFGQKSPRSIRLLAGGRLVERSAVTAAGDMAASAERVAPGRVRVTWKDAPGRGALVRDGRTGEVLSFARGRGATVETSATSVDVTVSDGVRNVHRRVMVRERGGRAP